MAVMALGCCQLAIKQAQENSACFVNAAGLSTCLWLEANSQRDSLSWRLLCLADWHRPNKRGQGHFQPFSITSHSNPWVNTPVGPIPVASPHFGIGVR